MQCIAGFPASQLASQVGLSTSIYPR